ncbi:class I SAM-dependent DNA methyltransferase [Pseudomonas sp. FP2300]|uniref:HsdM family class I SAM-dependent methyltransferase n=1 Tax=Pseudomonas sp. FP2300 TaxID=2954090 RepID=UPI00273535EE|nr:N-6 DNA methylase [Pseudomonas sp. FP2300]WLH63925.1 N-6 DNA methylase [Pseudomonas sp. FP2300]
MSAQANGDSFLIAEKTLASRSKHIETNSVDVVECCHVDSEAIKEEEASLLSFMGATQRKRQGVFFTPDELARLAASKIDFRIGGTVFDPACGTGNLLLKVADSLSASGSLTECLYRWNKKLYGLDINQEFVRLARKKIVGLAISKGALPTCGLTLAEAMAMLSNIRAGDFLAEYSSYVGVIDNVIMNPPFCPTDTPEDIKWTSGKCNAAALFMAYAIDIMPAGGKIVGILPDVLKSGSRYEIWRSEVFNSLNPMVEDFGSFQKDVQIDVFVLSGTKPFDLASASISNSQLAPEHYQVLEDRFRVSVGPVVPHRDPLVGTEAPFAHAKILPPWSTVNVLAERILHPGRKIPCPFVAVRRTSSPKDKFRVVGTIVDCDEAVAVENHIIAICPDDGSIESCISLLDFFKSSLVNDYINSKIRCRHLTVGIIKGLPIGEWHEYKE